jgi:hypothetical protein
LHARSDGCAGCGVVLLVAPSTSESSPFRPWLRLPAWSVCCMAIGGRGVSFARTSAVRLFSRTPSTPALMYMRGPVGRPAKSAFNGLMSGGILGGAECGICLRNVMKEIRLHRGRSGAIARSTAGDGLRRWPDEGWPSGGGGSVQMRGWQEGRIRVFVPRLQDGSTRPTVIVRANGLAIVSDRDDGRDALERTSALSPDTGYRPRGAPLETVVAVGASGPTVLPVAPVRAQ